MDTPQPAGQDVLSAPYVLEFAYTRSVGPVMGRFFSRLREGRIEGVRTRAGRILVPPPEYDPDTGEALSEFVEVGSSGTIRTWAWVAEPLPRHPFDRPFAFALIQLEGADTAMLHVVDAGQPSRMRTGARVRVRWRAQRLGEIRDIDCFELEEGP